MSLREHLFKQAAEAQIEPSLVMADAAVEWTAPRPASSVAEPASNGGMARRAYQQLKMEIHEAIIERVELDKLQHLSPEQVGRELTQLVGKLMEEGNILIEEEPRLHGVFFNKAISRRDHVAVYVVRRFRQTAPRLPDREIAEAGFFEIGRASCRERVSPYV